MGWRPSNRRDGAQGRVGSPPQFHLAGSEGQATGMALAPQFHLAAQSIWGPDQFQWAVARPFQTGKLHRYEAISRFLSKMAARLGATLFEVILHLVKVWVPRFFVQSMDVPHSCISFTNSWRHNMIQDWKGDKIAMHREASDLQTISHDSKIGRATISQRCFVLVLGFPKAQRTECTRS